MIDFTHKSGDTFCLVPFQVKKDTVEMDLTGVEIRMQLRKQPNARVEMELNLTNGGLQIVNALEGRFRIAQQIIKAEPFNYFYDIQFKFTDGRVKTYITGRFLISNDVTR